MAEFFKKVFVVSAQPTYGEVWQPMADIYHTKGGWVVKFDLAGVDPEDVHIQTRGSQLTISGVRRDTMVEQGCTYYSLEISYSRFERTINLPVDLDRAPIVADYQQGMLIVRIMEKEHEQ